MGVSINGGTPEKYGWFKMGNPIKVIYKMDDDWG